MENTEQLMSLLPIFLGILIIGIIVLSGWLVWAFTRRQSASKDHPPSGADAPAPGPRSRIPYYLLGVKPGEGDTWEVYVQGVRYANLTDVPDPQIRAAVRQAVKQAARFAGQAASSMEPSENAAPNTVPTTAGAERRRGSSSRSSVEFAELPTRRPAPRGGLLPVIDFAQEITDIIEELQERSPALQAHAVSLQNIPSGGINFLVDGKIYADIEEIPFPEVQALIRQATQAWEAQ